MSEISEKYINPTPQDLIRPEFEAVWQVIKHWDISRLDDPSYQKYMGEGIQSQTMYSGATGNDVMAILNALKPLLTDRDKAREVIKELEGALKYLVEESDEDTDDDYNPHAAPVALANAAIAKANAYLADEEGGGV